jgi:hypothetical protein
VHLVDHEDDVAEALDLVDEALHAALELAAELRAGDERREVEEVDLLVAQLVGHFGPLDDALREALGDGRLADARLADEAGVVLLAAVEDLDDALGLDLAADDLVELALARLLRQILAVGVENLRFLFFWPFGFSWRSARSVFSLLGFGRHVVVLRLVVEELVEEREGRRLAVLLVVVAVLVLVLVHHAVERLVHLAVEILEIVVRDAHALHDVVDGLDAELARALEAEALVDRLAVLDLRDEDDGYILFASGAKGGFHKRFLLI